MLEEHDGARANRGEMSNIRRATSEREREREREKIVVQGACVGSVALGFGVSVVSFATSQLDSFATSQPGLDL